MMRYAQITIVLAKTYIRSIASTVGAPGPTL